VKHIAYKTGVTFCAEKKGRAKITEYGTCSHCGALVHPHPEGK